MGELLRTGPFEQMRTRRSAPLCYPFRKKGDRLHCDAPAGGPALSSVRRARTKATGNGSLVVVLDGEIHITSEQAKLPQKPIATACLGLTIGLDQPTVLAVSSPTIKLLNRNRQHAYPAGNGDAHLQQVLKHVFVSGGADRSRQRKSMTYGPKANNGAQREGHNAKGGFEHSHPPFPPEGRTNRLP